MPRAQPGTDNPPALDADVASLPSNAPPVADPVPATAAVTPPDPETLNLIAVITPAGGVAFLDGNDLWWFYSDGGQRVRGRWSRCLGCGVFRTADGRVRCPAGAFLSGGRCRQMRLDFRSEPAYAPPSVVTSSWGKPLSCSGCTSQPAPPAPPAPAQTPLNLTELPVPAALASVFGVRLTQAQPPEGGVSFAYRGRTWWYFQSSAAAGGNIMTYGYWQDTRNRTCFGCGYFYEYHTGAAACARGYFLDARKLATCTKPASASSA